MSEVCPHWLRDFFDARPDVEWWELTWRDGGYFLRTSHPVEPVQLMKDFSAALAANVCAPHAWPVCWRRPNVKHHSDGSREYF